MADNEEENGMITIATGTLPSDAVIVANDVDQRVIQDDDAEDILQQAIQDAQEFGEEAVTLSYVTADGESDHDPNANTSIVAQELGNNVNIVSVSESSLNTSVVGAPTGSTDNGVSYDVSYVVSDMNQTGNMTLEENMDTVMLTPTESQLDTASVVSHQIPPTENIVTMHATNFSNSVQQGGLNVTLVPANQNSVAPIGSSQNPIRIVQQGNQYTPVQQLTAEQLQQIMHVVQEQQLAKSTDSSNGSSILYNPQTNTRIVYRVIYPSELHKNTGSSDQLDNSTSAISNPAGTDSSLGHRRTYKKRSREDDEDKVDGPEMSKEEKEERKKHRPRTRSGRVSKPPKHMVKDYKHIHVLDWDEDYDDSDGGYSDFKISDEDKSDPSSANNNNSNVNNNKGLDSSPDLIDASTGFERAKNYKCEGCDKAYIGHGGLRRHYQLNPSHGSIAEESDGGGGGDKGNCISTPNALTNSRTNGSVGSISEDSNTQDSLPSQTTPSMSAKMYRPRGRGRGRPCQSLDIPSKRRAKLQDLVRQCTDDELMEIVLPRLANVITLWEFLMMKVEKGGKALPKVDDIYHEFGTLHKQVAKTCQDCLEPIPDTKSSSMPGDDKLQVDDAVLATCLGLKVGPYQVKPLPKEEKSFHYKYLTTEPQNIPAKRQNNRRTIEIVTPDELKQLGSKKTNMTTLLTSPVSVGSKAPQAAPVSLITSSNTTSSSSPLSLLSTPISSSQSATPMQIVVNNHKSVSESVQLPVTSHLVNSVVTNNGILHNNALQRQPPHTTVLLTNCATLPSSSASFTTLNGTSGLTVNGNASVLETSKNTSNSLPVLLPPTSSVMTTANGTSVDRSSVNSVFVSNNNNNNAVKMDNGQRQNVNESLLSSFVCSVAQENNSVPLKTPDMIVNKLEDVSDDLTVSMDQSEPMDIQVQLNGACVQETTALQSQVGEPGVSMGELEGEQVFNAEQIEGEIISPDQIVTQASNIFQTEDGTLIIQNPDGTTFQLQGAEGIPLETVQALLAMDGEGQFVEQEQMQAEMQ